MPSKHQDPHKHHLQCIAKTRPLASTMEVSKHQDDTQEQKAKRPSQLLSTHITDQLRKQMARENNKLQNPQLGRK